MVLHLERTYEQILSFKNQKNKKKVEKYFFTRKNVSKMLHGRMTSYTDLRAITDRYIKTSFLHSVSLYSVQLNTLESLWSYIFHIMLYNCHPQKSERVLRTKESRCKGGKIKSEKLFKIQNQRQGRSKLIIVREKLISFRIIILFNINFF